ncbi:MAG: glycosyltransferase family 2 protein [Anaerolineae bacterium]
MKASVIIPVWNGMEYLRDCLDALLAQDYPDFEVIAVDNASTDGSADFIAEHYPGVRLIRNEQNVGFVGACNRGLGEGEGEVLVLLNQDTRVEEGWLSNLVRTISEDSTVGIVGCKLLYPDGRLQHAGGCIDVRGNSHHFGRGEKDVGQFDERREVDFVTGAGLAISRPAFEVVGKLDEGYTIGYYEDVDWCYRVAKAGFRVVYEPSAVMVHKEASLLAEFDDHRRVYLPHRNRLRFVLKHLSLSELREGFLLAERSWLESLGEGEERLVAMMHRIYLYYLLNLHELVKARRAFFDPSTDEGDIIALVLLSLRTVVPLKPAGLDDSLETFSVTAADECLLSLRERRTLEEPDFYSDIPWVGDLIAAFRRQWNNISTKWYVRSLIRQQMDFNTQVVTMFERLYEDHQRLGKVLAEYIREDGHEIGELSKKIQNLNEIITDDYDI